jgi:hypothetical protein
MFRGFPSVPREVSKGPCYDLCSGEFPVFQKKSYQCSGDSPVFQEKFLRAHVIICVLESFQLFQNKAYQCSGNSPVLQGTFLGIHVMICVLESSQCFRRNLISVSGDPQCSKGSSEFWRVSSVSEEILSVFRGFPSVPREVSKGPYYNLCSGEIPVFQKKAYQCSGNSPVFQEKFLRVHVMICVLESFQYFRRNLISVPGIPHWLKLSF